MDICSRPISVGSSAAAFMAALVSDCTGGRRLSHVAIPAQLFQAVLAVLEAAGTLGDILERAAADLDDDLVDVLGGALDGGLARAAAQAAVAGAAALVVVERDGGDVLALDVLPDVELGPVEQGMHPHVGAGGEVGLELVPELGRLIAHVPEVVLVARGEVALLGTAPLLVGAGPHDHPVVRPA